MVDKCGNCGQTKEDHYKETYCEIDEFGNGIEGKEFKPNHSPQVFIEDAQPLTSEGISKIIKNHSPQGLFLKKNSLKAKPEGTPEEVQKTVNSGTSTLSDKRKDILRWLGEHINNAYTKKENPFLIIEEFEELLKEQDKEFIEELKEEIRFDSNNEELSLSTKAHNQWCNRVIEKIAGKELT